MGMKSAPPPDVFTYVDFRRYLGDWFAAQKQADRRYSHRLFARRAGVGSPSLLGEVIAGKRNLTAPSLEGFVTAMRLDHAQAAFFSELVAFGQATTSAEKNKAWQRISASRRFRSARPIDAGLMAYLGNWYYPAIRELAWRRDFRAEPEWIARQLDPRITVAQARDALHTLLELGMLVADGDAVKPRDISVATAHQLQPLAALNYHHGMLDRAHAALDRLPGDQRHFLGVTVAVPESLLPVLKTELDAVQERLLDLCDQHVDQAERVYQLQLLLFPLTTSPGDPL